MKNFSFLALIAMVLCLVGCGPKETQTPLGATDEYVLYSMSDAPDKVGVKSVNGLKIIPNVYSQISYSQGYFIGQLDGKYLLLTPENKMVFQSNEAIVFNTKLNCFESKDGNKTKLFFPQENGKIFGEFLSYEPDANNNLRIKEKDKFGIYAKNGKTIIPIANEMLILENGTYIALNSKNAKQPMLNDKGQITNWNRVKITAYDKDGKEVKAPSLAQVKKLIK